MAPDTHIEGDLTGLLSPYLWNKRVQAARPYLEGRKQALDIGCGIFRWSGILPPGMRYVGIDVEEAIVAHNSRNFPHRFIRADAESDPIEAWGSDFDLVLMLAVLEHFKDPASVLKRIRKLQAADCILVITTPHPTGESILNLGARCGIFSRDKHQHERLLDRHAIARLAASASYRVLSYKKILFGLNQLAVLG